MSTKGRHRREVSRLKSVPGSMRAVAMLAMATLVTMVGIGPSLADSGPATVTISYVSPQTFSPNNDGYEDSTQVQFCLDRSANVTATASNADGVQVRTFAYQASYAAGCQPVTWNGRDDGGSVLPDGTYDIKLTAVNATGIPTSDTKPVAIDHRLPGALSAPTPGAQLSGTAQFAFTPTAGVNVTQMYFAVSAPGGSCGSSLITSPDGDGRFVWSTDTSSCGDGAGQVTATVYWADGFGQQHGYATPALAVTLANPKAPVTSVLQISPQTFSPNGDGQEDVAYVYYCVNDTGDQNQVEQVKVRVLDGAGNVVRTLVDQDQPLTGQGTCTAWYGGYRYTQWDGLDDNSWDPLESTCRHASLSIL